MRYCFAILIVALLIGFPGSIFCQNNTDKNAKLDSLQNALNKSKNDTNRVRILIELADVLRFPNPDSAIIHAQSAEALALELSDPVWRLKSLLSLGEIYHYPLQQQDKALQFAEPAERLASEIGSKKQMIDVYYLYGKIFEAKGERNLAINYFE